MRRWGEFLVAAWLGAAILASAVVAPAAFAVLPTRALAGDLVGRVLPVLFLVGAVLSPVYWLLDRRSADARRARRHAALGVWFVAMVLAQFVVTPRIQRLRTAGPLESLASDDPRRLTFGRLHGVSVGLLGVGMVTALVVLMTGVATERERLG